MKEVGNKLRTLRGKRSLEDSARRTGMSRETLRKIEGGACVKLKTLKAISYGLGATHADWCEILCAWLRFHAQREIHHVRIEPILKTSKLRDAGKRTATALQTQFTTLTLKEQEQLLKAINRPAVLRSLVHLNTLFESK